MFQTCSAVCSGFTHNHPDIGSNQGDLQQVLDRQTVGHPDNGILFSSEKRWVSKPRKAMEEP